MPPILLCQCKGDRMKNKLYVAYGSNLNLPQMLVRCPNAKVVGASEIKDYALVFRGGRYGAVATIEPKEGASVPVLLWKITPKDENALDIYEGFPRLYKKETMKLEMDDKNVSAMVYVMTPGHSPGIPTASYYNTICEGYKTAGFDTKIVENAVEYSEELMDIEHEPEQGNSFGIDGMKGR